jgi:glycosyltransferase involved in cell wall biosynthesis
MSSRPRRVLFLANTDWYLWNFRLPLARAMHGQGWDVVLCSPPGPWGPRFAGEGLRWIPFDFARHGLNPFSELVTLARLVRLYRRERPDLAHHFTIKCVLYGGIAAKLSGTRVVNAVTGLGSLFTTPKKANVVLVPIVRVLYRLVFHRSHVIFQNPDDREEFRAKGLLGDATVHIIRSSGVDTTRFQPAPRLPAAPPVVVILVARLLREKGIEEFVEAARWLRGEGAAARFIVVGPEDPAQPSAIDSGTLARWKGAGDVEFLGHRDDVLELLRSAHIACLPSWREGTPRSLVEAMACGLPVVATDVPGCREVTRNGDNGLLVKARDAMALAKGLRTLIDDAELRRRMGERSRERAEAEFSEKRVIGETTAVYQAVLS